MTRRDEGPRETPRLGRTSSRKSRHATRQERAARVARDPRARAVRAGSNHQQQHHHHRQSHLYFIIAKYQNVYSIESIILHRFASFRGYAKYVMCICVYIYTQ